MKLTGLRYLVTMMVLSFADGSSITAAPLGTAFNYQGRLSSDTNAANGLYDFQFSLWDGSGSTATQVGTTQMMSSVAINNGAFNAVLDFGAGAFNGESRWLELAVRTNGAASFSTLSPRQNLTPVPYAIAASNLSGTLPTTQLVGALPGGFLSGIYSNAVILNNPANTFAGNGAALTGVDATTLGGYGFCSLPCYWNLSGNTGTTPGANFLGTLDNQPLELKVNNQRAFRLDPTTNSPNLIGGFLGNRVTNIAVGVTIGGGVSNQIYGTSSYVNMSYATIPGGWNNSATNFAFAAGCRAKAVHQGAFVWADNNEFDFPSTNANSFSVRAVGGTRFVSAIDGVGNPTAGVVLEPGSGSWTMVSDRNAKENVSPVSGSDVLERLDSVPIATWNYKSQDKSVRHIGPMAQDFAAAFHVGESDHGIGTVDADGVALAAIQGLHQMLKEKDSRIESLEKDVAELKTLVGTLAHEVKR